MIYIISPFESIAEGRGTRNIVLANLLSKENNKDVTFLTTSFSHQNKKKHNLVDFKVSDQSFQTIIMDVIPYKKNLSVTRFLTHFVVAVKIMQYLKNNIKEGDIVIASSIPPEVIYMIAKVKEKINFKIILDVRDIWPEAFPITGVLKTVFNKYCDFFYKSISKKIDSFVYVAPSFKRWINKYTDENNTLFLPLGYDQNRWCPKPYNHNQYDVIKLVYIGYLESQFDLTNIIRAISNRVERFHLTIIGSGSKECLYRSLTASKNITYTGSLSQEESANIVCDNHIGILPIAGTAHFPNKLFDYIGAAIPIIGIGDSDSSKFIDKHSIGWVSDFQIINIEKTLDSVDLLSIQQKKENISFLRERFSKNTIYSNYIDLINGFYNK